jgi:hypothetical protein
MRGADRGRPKFQLLGQVAGDQVPFPADVAQRWLAGPADVLGVAAARREAALPGQFAGPRRDSAVGPSSITRPA